MKKIVGKIIFASLLATLILLTSGCVTGIRDMSIASIETVLKDAKGNRVKALLPNSVIPSISR